MPRVRLPAANTYGSSLDDPQGYSSSLERGLTILDCFTFRHTLLGCTEVAHELGMTTPTTHRYISTLRELGYLEQGPERKYRLTLAVTRLGLSALSGGSLQEHASPYLRELRRQLTYTTALAVLDGGEAVYIERLPSLRWDSGAIDPAPGSRLPTYCTAMGKVLLASLPEPEQHALIAGLRLARYTPNTTTSKTELRAELNFVAAQGFAVNDQEYTPGLRALSAPVRDESRVIAAVCIAAPTTRITLEEMIDHLTPHLLATADRISARLGYRRTDKHHKSPRL